MHKTSITDNLRLKYRSVVFRSRGRNKRVRIMFVTQTLKNILKKQALIIKIENNMINILLFLVLFQYMQFSCMFFNAPF